MLLMNILSECHTKKQNNKVPLSSVYDVYHTKYVSENTTAFSPSYKSVAEEDFGVVIY